jgi:hypothetical protein
VAYRLVLTHDIDAIALTELPPGRTLAGFFYRCLVENLVRLVERRLTLSDYLRSVRDVAGYFPAKLGLGLDVWAKSLDVMLALERKHQVRSTLFFIPLRNEPGVLPGDGHRQAPHNRAAHYAIQAYRGLLQALVRDEWEVGVHGVNAWRGVREARAELDTLRAACPDQGEVGVRMHWLYSRPGMWQDLETAGFRYDSTLGWDERVGFPDARYRPFRPAGTRAFAVVPLNVQDGALLAREHRNLRFSEAWTELGRLLEEADRRQGTLTVLWHNTSFVAPRFWGDLYEALLERARRDGAEIMTAGAAARIAEDEPVT